MGRRRTTFCSELHVTGEPCRACDRERARRYRRKHPERTRALTRRRLGDPAYYAAMVARATLYRALARGELSPPLRCDRCATLAEQPLRPLLHDVSRPRSLLWVCGSCRRFLRAVGGEVAISWTWPGPRPPRRTRSRPVFDESLHRRSLQVALSHPTGTAQEDAYATTYLAECANPPAWYAWGVHLGAAWQPTPHPVVNELWRRYMARWWQRERERASRTAEILEVVTLAARPIPERRSHSPQIPHPSHSRTVAPMGPVLSEEEQLAKLAEAEAAFDARIDAILARMSAAGAAAPRRDTDESR